VGTKLDSFLDSFVKGSEADGERKALFRLVFPEAEQGFFEIQKIKF
jgi:hypothetical protein